MSRFIAGLIISACFVYIVAGMSLLGPGTIYNMAQTALILCEAALPPNKRCVITAIPENP